MTTLEACAVVIAVAEVARVVIGVASHRAATRYTARMDALLSANTPKLAPVMAVPRGYLAGDRCTHGRALWEGCAACAAESDRLGWTGGKD